MKILFVEMGIDFWGPLGLMQISAMAKKRGHKTYLTFLSKENVLKKIENIKPDIVAYGASTHEYKDFLKLNRSIKSKYKDIFTIMGGPHPTFFPEVLNEGNLDAICIGEGEYAFIELLDALENKKDISKLKNIVVRGGTFNGLRPLVQDIDSLPFPDRELFYKESQIKGEHIPAMTFITSRGYPYNCTYCFNHSFRQMYPGEKYIRKRSVDNVLQEIKMVKERFGIKFVKFVDDAFIFKQNDKWLEEFCERYPKEIGLPFLIYSRFELMTARNAELLNKAGCSTVFMSIESTNPRIREKILDRMTSDEQILQGAKSCIENGITIILYLMLGLPTSTLKDDIKSIDFCIKAGIQVPEFWIYQPLPKTELSNFCLREGLIDESFVKNQEKGGFKQESVLDCFTQKEKNAQRNIAVLGPIVVRHPFLRNLVMNHLIYLPNNFLFNKIYAIDKIITYTSRVYTTKYSFKEKLNVIKRALKLETSRVKN